MHVWKLSLISKKKNTITAFVTFVRFVKLVTFVTFVVIRKTLLLLRFDSFDSSFCRTTFDHVQSSQSHVMLSDDAQLLFVCHLIRVRDRFTNAERNANEKRNATSLRFEKRRERSHSTTFEKRKESYSTTLKKKKKSHSTTFEEEEERSHSTTLSSSTRRRNEWLEIRVVDSFANEFDFDDDDDCIFD